MIVSKMKSVRKDDWKHQICIPTRRRIYRQKEDSDIVGPSVRFKLLPMNLKLYSQKETVPQGIIHKGLVG